MTRRSARAAQQLPPARASDVQARADAPSRAPPSYSSRTLWPDGVGSTSRTPYKQFPHHHRASTCAAPLLPVAPGYTQTTRSGRDSKPACLLSYQRGETDMTQSPQPAPDGWSCKGRGDDMRNPLVTGAPALRMLCSRARAGDDRLGPQCAGQPAQTRPQCAPGLHCSVNCSLGVTTGAPWGTQARCRWADLPVPAGLQALLGRQGCPNHLALRQ